MVFVQWDRRRQHHQLTVGWLQALLQQEQRSLRSLLNLMLAIN